ncbi:hypothetical protein GCM10027344_20660 [Spelaeicoccus albus]
MVDDLLPDGSFSPELELVVSWVRILIPVVKGHQDIRAEVRIFAHLHACDQPVLHIGVAVTMPEVSRTDARLALIVSDPLQPRSRSDPQMSTRLLDLLPSPLQLVLGQNLVILATQTLDRIAVPCAPWLLWQSTLGVEAVEL